MSSRNSLFVPALLAVSVAACAVSPTGRRQLALVSEDSAIVASEEAYAMQIGELREAGKIVAESSSAARRVDAITGRLVAQAIEMRPETADWEWSIEVIDDPKWSTRGAWPAAAWPCTPGLSRSSIRPMTSSRRSWRTRSATRSRITRRSACRLR